MDSQILSPKFQAYFLPYVLVHAFVPVCMYFVMLGVELGPGTS